MELEAVSCRFRCLNTDFVVYTSVKTLLDGASGSYLVDCAAIRGVLKRSIGGDETL